MGQRYVKLGEIALAGGAVSVPGPADSNIAPPGYYMLFVVDANGVPSVSSIVLVRPSVATGVPDDAPSRIATIEITVRTNSEIVFTFAPSPADVAVQVVDVRGRIIKTLLDEAMPPSTYSIQWDGRNERGTTVASGIYFVRLRVNGMVRAAKLAFVR